MCKSKYFNRHFYNYADIRYLGMPECGRILFVPMVYGTNGANKTYVTDLNDK